MSNINELVKRWILEIETEKFEDNEILDMLIELPSDDPDKTAAFISAALEVTDNRDVLGALAVGPLEDLFSFHPDVAADLERKEKDNPKFQLCMDIKKV